VSRTDFALLPFAVFLSTLIIYKFNEKKELVIATFLGLAGTVTGVFLTLVHNYIFTGEFLQSSAKMKAHWMQIYGANYQGATLITRILGIERTALKTLILIFGVALLFFPATEKYKKNRSFDRPNL